MKTPQGIITKFEEACQELDYGMVTLTLFIKQGKPRYVIGREESYIPHGEPSALDDFYVKEETEQENKQPYRTILVTKITKIDENWHVLVSNDMAALKAPRANYITRMG